MVRQKLATGNVTSKGTASADVMLIRNVPLVGGACGRAVDLEVVGEARSPVRCRGRPRRDGLGDRGAVARSFCSPTTLGEQRFPGEPAERVSGAGLGHPGRDRGTDEPETALGLLLSRVKRIPCSGPDHAGALSPRWILHLSRWVTFLAAAPVLLRPVAVRRRHVLHRIPHDQMGSDEHLLPIPGDMPDGRVKPAGALGRPRAGSVRVGPDTSTSLFDSLS